ncbi:MAG: TonB-dependent receptor plug domain-containing protein [Flavobacteriales bacterium]|nr:TonB-dependent receptor plug domain-containing protein [Flavobacteriales bacterium]
MQVDRRVFNVEKDLSTQGGTGVDVMKNVPGLSVDLDGNVEMRGARPQILVDGRPSAMTLEQIPAEDIERVEVITNPSVAFDANATGGIINVVLKKNTKPGYSGQVQAGIGTNRRYQAGANINMKEGRWGFSLSYNYNTSANVTDGNTDAWTEPIGTSTWVLRAGYPQHQHPHDGRWPLGCGLAGEQPQPAHLLRQPACAQQRGATICSSVTTALDASCTS